MWIGSFILVLYIATNTLITKLLTLILPFLRETHLEVQVFITNVILAYGIDELPNLRETSVAVGSGSSFSHMGE